MESENTKPKEQELEAAQEETDQEAETEVEETEEEAPEAEESETEEAAEEPKATKVENRIAKLVAKLKAKDEELADARAQIAEQEQAIAQEHEAILKVFKNKPDAITYKQKPVVELSDEEFDQAVADCLLNDEISKEGRLAIVKEAKAQRAEYQKALGPVSEDAQKLNKDALKVWDSEWAAVKAEFVDLVPNLESELTRINKAIEQDLASRPTLVEQLKKGPVAKFKYAQKVLERLGIDYETDSEPAAEAAETLGKGKQSPAIKAKPKTFTREQIGKMTPEEFDKNEKAIEKALREKRIR